MDIHDYYRYNIQEIQYMTKNNYVTPESICHPRSLWMCGACLSEAPTSCSVSVCHIEGSLKGRGVSVYAILTFLVPSYIMARAVTFR